MATRQLSIVTLYALHGGEVFASHSVQCAISPFQPVDAKPKQRSQEDKATAWTEVWPAASLSLDSISVMSSLVIFRPII